MAHPAIAVIGAGLMGHGIAYRLAAAGHEVRVHDPDPGARQALAAKIGDICDLLGTSRAALERISGHDDLASAVAGVEVVIEAAPERLELKQSIFAELERLTATGTILASNTSALPIARIAEKVGDRSRVVGTHFWNPPHLVPLVEVVLMGEANRASAEKASALLLRAGWHPVTVNRDIPGFIGNRLQHALKREAIALVAAGVCDAETIDDVVKLGFGARLAVLGPLEQSDLVGLNLTKSIHDTLMPDLDVTAVTHPYLQDLVARGDLGMKTGQGFRSWMPDQAEAVRQRLREFLVSQARSRRQD
ncbi:MAG: 3-hydroxyacyl-CoA dehydrogenase NAD-binding domain-containing protein [Ancalomicrobiaceae bacterium]|nr:3-hydroxyacyl-CoA dehydrogenase NAD-binding domain-containing protein [Ancalomicrobiaceae bacterium]